MASAAILLVEERGLCVARRRPRARARAARSARLARLRGRVVGAGGTADAGRAPASSCGRSRCRRWSSSIACGACRSSTSPQSTSCSASPGWAARCATRPGGRSTSAAPSPDTLQFLLDGRVEVTTPARPPSSWSAPAPLAFEEMLEGHPMRAASAPSSRRSACRSPPRVPVAPGRERGAGRRHVALADRVAHAALSARCCCRRPRRRSCSGRSPPACRPSTACCSCSRARCSRPPPGAQLLRLAASARPADVQGRRGSLGQPRSSPRCWPS